MSWKLLHPLKAYFKAFAITLLLLPCIATANDYSFPGGIAQVELEKLDKRPPNVRFGTKEVLVLDQQDRWLAVFGLALDIIPGEYLLYVKPHSKEAESYIKKFEVLPPEKQFELHSIGLENPKLPKSFSALDFENSSPPKFPFSYPVAGKWENRFGQVMLGNPKEISNRLGAIDSDKVKFQTYLSLTTTALETIHSPQDGLISLIEPYRDRSYSVYIDHGRDLYSILHGVTDLNIEIGNGIIRDAVIGKVPSDTSIEKPATIIWQTSFNKVLIDPETLTKLR
jgi:hypothetical protein